MIPLAVDDRFFPAATHRFVKGPKIMDLENSCECVVLEDFLQEVEEQLPT